MIPEICLCFAETDRVIAEAVADRLHSAAEVRTCLEPASVPVTEIWDRGIDSAGILLFLSPDSVPPRLQREDWAGLLEQATPPVASLVIRECPVPALLKRRRFFLYDDRNALRELQKWAISLHPAAEPPPFVPAAFPQQSTDLDALWTALVDHPGVAEAASTDDAHTFAHLASPWFRDVIWIACARRSPACFAGEVSALIGATLDGPEAAAFERALDLALRHRVLLVLDGLEPDIQLPTHRQDMFGSVMVTRRADLPRAASDAPDAALLEAMCVCVPGSVPLELPAAMLKMPLAEALRAADRLASDGLIARLDPSGSRFRLRARAHPRKVEPFRSRHAQVLFETFSRYVSDTAGCVRLLPEIELAVRWAVVRDWSIASRLAASAATFLRSLGRLSEAAYLLDIVLWAANDRGDRSVAEQCEWELSWIRGGVNSNLRTTVTAAEQIGFEF